MLKKRAAKSAGKKKTKGVGDVAIAALRAGKSNEQALAAVKAAFPKAATTASSIAWYRNKLRDDGEKVKTARELKKAAAKK
jgi:hypothetical protein